MTAIIPLETEIIEKINIQCMRCNKKMHKKVLNNPICSYCIIDLKKIDTEQKKLQKQQEKEKKLSDKKNEYEKHLYQYDDNTRVYNSTGEYKICKNCEENKYFKEFYIIKDNKSKEGRYYLNGKCKECSSKTQVKKSNKLEKIINNYINNNN
jgi:hypothetical protein